MTETISETCDVPSHYVDVLGSRMHYLQTGQGKPLVFLHGMPTSSFLWRNVIPHLSPFARCIAPDLIGMGKSDKPDIAYTVFDHMRYLTAFIEGLGLSEMTLVMHGWGSVVGLGYAHQNSTLIRGLVCHEAHLFPHYEWESLSLPVQQLATLLNKPGASYQAIVQENYLLKKLLPHGMLRQLTPLEQTTYEAPFDTPEARKPLWQYVLDLPYSPLGEAHGKVLDLITGYSQWLTRLDVPKLLLYAVPGFITPIETVRLAKQMLPQLTIKELPDSLHFAQETHPHAYGQLIAEWYQKITFDQ